MTFGAFLRAKNFVRDLTPVEIAELRRHVQSVKCTGCGAAVDVREHSACAFCRAPIAMIDPDQLQRTIAALQEKEARRPKAEPGKERAPGRSHAAAAARAGAASRRARLRRSRDPQQVGRLHCPRHAGSRRRRAVVDRVDPREPRRRPLIAVSRERPAKHRDGRGARRSRREEGEYWQIPTDEQRRAAGCIGRRMPRGVSRRAAIAACRARLRPGAPRHRRADPPARREPLRARIRRSRARR